MSEFSKQCLKVVGKKSPTSSWNLEFLSNCRKQQGVIYWRSMIEQANFNLLIMINSSQTLKKNAVRGRIFGQA